jgi:hypothetical protein
VLAWQVVPFGHALGVDPQTTRRPWSTVHSSAGRQRKLV